MSVTCMPSLELLGALNTLQLSPCTGFPERRLLCLLRTAFIEKLVY